MNHLEYLKYPIGQFIKPSSLIEQEIEDHYNEIELFPNKLKSLIDPLTENDLKKTYRPQSWNIAQIVNHCADSHMNAFVRLKLTLTEDNPTIKPYLENEWIKLEDSNLLDIKYAMMIIEGLHFRWNIVNRSLTNQDLLRTYYHPELKEQFYLYQMLAMYNWHGNQHLAHIKLALGMDPNA